MLHSVSSASSDARTISTVEMRQSNTLNGRQATTLISPIDFHNSSYEESVGFHLLMNAGAVTNGILIFCGGYHIPLSNKQPVQSVMLLIWRLILGCASLGFIATEVYFLCYNAPLFHDIIIRVALLIQFIVIFPTVYNTSERFQKPITGNQKTVLDGALRIVHRYFWFGVAVSIWYGALLWIHGLYYLNTFHLFVEGFGYSASTVLSTWPMVFVIMDASVTTLELSDLISLTNTEKLTSEVYKTVHNNSYQLVNSNSVVVCDGIAFAAYFSMFSFVLFILTTPANNSLVVSIEFCLAVLSREASFIFFIFPYLADVNITFGKLLLQLSEYVWVSSNGVDSSSSLCLLAMHKPLSLKLLGRIATANEMRAQIAGIVVVTLTSLLRLLGAQYEK